MMRSIPYVLLIGALFAGCTKPQPSLQLLENEVQNKMPKHLNASITESRLSPMKEILGTTLPEGSWQADLKVTMSPKENLYLAYTPIEVLPGPAQVEAVIPEEARSQILALQPVLKWNFRRNALLLPENQKQLVFIVTVATPATRKDAWIKLLAEPRGKEWKMGLLEGIDPAGIYGNARTKADFGQNAFVWGSPEQVAAVRLLEKEKADDDARLEADRQEREKQRLAAEILNDKRRKEAELHRAKIEELRPAVDALREKENSLAKEYKGQVQEKLDELYQEYSDKTDAFERYKNQLFSTTPDVTERNRLTEKATKDWWSYRVENENKAVELQKGFRAAEIRAKKETKAAIDTICKEAGIDPKEYAN